MADRPAGPVGGCRRPLHADADQRLVPARGRRQVRIAAALEALYLTAALWIVLVCMLMVGGVGGSMPRWAAWLAGILVPASGVANITAVDMCSRHMPWAIVFLLAAGAPARLLRLVGAPAVASRQVAGRTHQRRCVGAVFVLSVASFVLAA